MQSPTVEPFRQLSLAEYPDGNDKSTVENVWQQVIDIINQLYHAHESRATDKPTGFSSQAVQSCEISRQCCNSQCQKPFGLLERKRVCTRCRRAFCKRCTSYERRLNCAGGYDSNGQMKKVCEACFNVGSQIPGETRNLFSTHFLPMRNQHKLERIGRNGRNISTAVSRKYRYTLNFEQECQRICQGFVTSVMKLQVGQILNDVFRINKPDWEKSSGLVYGNMADQCSGCLAKIGTFQWRHNCTICGDCVCEKCSSCQLIVYIPDEDDEDSNALAAKLAIIKIVGCPTVEPKRCRYLRVCEPCNHQIQERQISEYQLEHRRESSDCESVESVWMLIGKVHGNLQSVQTRIIDDLAKYCNLIDSLDAGSNRTTVTVSYSSNMQVLAKAQGDLADHFTKFVTDIYSMKNLKPSTPGQSMVLKRLTQAKRDFYIENMSQFRALQRQLETVVSCETLKAIQDEVDRKAMNSCYVAMKQLLFEVLHVREKHRMDADLPMILLPVEQAAEVELRSCIIDPWPEHEQVINELIKCQLSKHRYLSRLPTSCQTAVATKIFSGRIRTVLEQISLQLNSKASTGKFTGTKTALRQAIIEVGNFFEDGDWVFVQR